MPLAPVILDELSKSHEMGSMVRSSESANVISTEFMRSCARFLRFVLRLKRPEGSRPTSSSASSRQKSRMDSCLIQSVSMKVLADREHVSAAPVAPALVERAPDAIRRSATAGHAVISQVRTLYNAEPTKGYPVRPTIIISAAHGNHHVLDGIMIHFRFLA